MWLIVALSFLLSLSSCEDQDLLSVLKRTSGISQFIAQLESRPDLLDSISNGTTGRFTGKHAQWATLRVADLKTVLAYSDDAFEKYAQANANLSQDLDHMEALLQYHIVRGSYTIADFADDSIVPATLLSNQSYTKVSGGQRLELTSQDGKPVVVSGIKAASKIVTPDILVQGGIVQVIDTLLTIPESVSSTISRLGLTDLLALLNLGGFTDPTSPSVQLVNEAPDLTIFPPNDPRFGAKFKGFEGFSQFEIRKVLNYSILQELTPLYSPDFENATTHKNLDGLSLLVTASEDDFYIDQARVKVSNYFVANGVFHTLDSLLNPNTTGIGPILDPADDLTAPSSSRGLSSAAAAGVGIGVGALVLGLLLGGALYIRNRKRRGLPLFSSSTHRRRRSGRRGQHRLPEQDTPGIPQPIPRTIGGDHNPDYHHQIHRGTVELTSPVRQSSYPPVHPPRYGTHELDNKAPVPHVSRIDTHVSNTDSSLMSASHRSGGQISVVEVRNADGTITTTTTRSPSRLDAPLPPKPPSPQEIDGRERSRISVHISGEAPRHLGFQARY